MTMPQAARPWTKEETDFLFAFAETETQAEIAKALRRTITSIRYKYSSIMSPYLKSEDYKMYKRMKDRKRNRLPKRVEKHYKNKKRINKRTVANAHSHRQIWTLHENEYLLSHANEEATAIALHLGRSKFAIQCQRKRLRECSEAA
jgi:hypothetical protein